LNDLPQALLRHDFADDARKYWNSPTFDDDEQAEFDFSLQTRLVESRAARVAAELVS
jgi:hypothetical protein